jgi:hypothetical protein
VQLYATGRGRESSKRREKGRIGEEIREKEV